MSRDVDYFMGLVKFKADQEGRHFDQEGWNKNEILEMEEEIR